MEGYEMVEAMRIKPIYGSQWLHKFRRVTRIVTIKCFSFSFNVNVIVGKRLFLFYMMFHLLFSIIVVPNVFTSGVYHYSVITETMSPSFKLHTCETVGRLSPRQSQ